MRALLLLAVLPLRAFSTLPPEANRTMKGATVHELVGPIESPLSLEVTDFLLDHPDLAAWFVRRRKIAPYVIEMETPTRSRADDGEGTSGFIELVDRQPGRRSYYTEGTHVSRIFPDIRASAVVIMTIDPVQKPGCRQHVVSSFDVYVRMRSGFVSAMVRVLKPFIKGTLVRKFTKAFSVAAKIGVLLARQPEAARKELLSYPGLSAEDKERLKTLLSSVEPEDAACLPGR
ncbi:MAG: hypothetical protein HYZ75_02740 [Elusimicrobia bacterium]|nr:hypothetical protein [Elusimicrobiota bacterium]